MCRVEILTGPPRSGRTESVISAALPFIQENRCTELLILVPSNLKADELRETILDRPEVKGFIGLRIDTFFDVTQEIFHASSYAGRIRSPMARRWAVQRLITSLELPVLQNIQESRGLTDLAVDLIRALKDGDVSPETFMKSADFPGAPPSLREMASIFRAYESERERAKLLDREDLFGLSVQVLRSPDAPVFAGLRQVLVTGFYDFTPLQLKLLAALGSLRNMETMQFTLLHPEGSGPARRFVERTVDRIGHVFPRARVIPLPKPKNEAFTPLDHLRRHLLSEQEETAAVAGDDSISVMHTPGNYREVEETARQIRRFILDGGRTFKDFAVVFRDLNRYQETVREVFRLYQIPHRTASGLPLRHNPLVQSVMSLLEVPRSNFEREAVVRFLRSDYLKLKDAGPRTVSAERFDTLSREAMIHGGEAQWTAQFKNQITLLERRLHYLEEGSPEDRETGKEKARIYRKKAADYRGCMALMANLMETVKPIPKQGSVGRFVDVVSDLITALHGEQAIYAVGDPRLIRRDQRGLRRLDELLSELKAEHQAPGQKISLNQFIQLLGETLAETTYGPDRTEEDGVLVIDALGMRELHRPVVFVGGLVEESFPRTHMAGPFLGDEARDRINSAMGPDRWLSRSADWRDEEELLFLLAAASATEQLCLTYPRTDSQGRDLLPSRYVEKVLALFSEGTLSTAAVSLSDPLPDRNLIFRQSELLEYTFLHLAQEPGLEPDTPILYNHLLGHQREKVDSLRHGLAVVQARKDGIGPYVGRPGRSVADRIRRDETTYSASALELYGACPFQYFCERELKAEPLEDVEDEINVMDMGSLYHQILERFYRALAGPVTAENLGAAREQMAAVIDQFLSRQEYRGVPGHKKLWEIRKAEVHETLDRFVGQEKKYSEEAREVPSHFEASFGMIPRQQSDPLSTAEPLTIDSESGPIRLMGKVDRIDVSGGDGGQRHFSVVDYKTGKHAPSSNAVIRGESLQLPLYTAWAKGALGANYGVHKASFYLLKSGEKKCQIPTRNTSWEDAWGLARQFIQNYVESIRGGMFPMGEKKCSPYCRYGAVCRIGEE